MDIPILIALLLEALRFRQPRTFCCSSWRQRHAFLRDTEAQPTPCVMCAPLRPLVRSFVSTRHVTSWGTRCSTRCTHASRPRTRRCFCLLSTTSMPLASRRSCGGLGVGMTRRKPSASFESRPSSRYAGRTLPRFEVIRLSLRRPVSDRRVRPFALRSLDAPASTKCEGRRSYCRVISTKRSISTYRSNGRV